MIIKQAFQEKGILTDQPLLLCELKASECTLNDGEPEYQVIDGNHCVSVACEMNFSDLDWRCNIIKVLCFTFYINVFICISILATSVLVFSSFLSLLYSFINHACLHDLDYTHFKPFFSSRNQCQKQF